MLVAGIDFETNSVDAETCSPTEVGIIIWDPKKDVIVETISKLIFVPDEIEVSNHAITGITKDMVSEYGWINQDIRSMLTEWLSDSDWLMAHNVAFDRTILNRITPINKPWIDTMTDVPYPAHIRTRSLPYLAVEHGFMNPFSHRALFDVMAMIKVASAYDFDEILRYAKSPTIWIQAVVSYDDRQLAKDRYFRWDPTNKLWVKQVKELNLEYEEERGEFPIDLLQGYVYKEKYS
jgi:DNA polymerase-3 subunit epsilon